MATNKNTLDHGAAAVKKLVTATGTITQPVKTAVPTGRKARARGKV